MTKSEGSSTEHISDGRVDVRVIVLMLTDVQPPLSHSSSSEYIRQIFLVINHLMKKTDIFQQNL